MAIIRRNGVQLVLGFGLAERGVDGHGIGEGKENEERLVITDELAIVDAPISDDDIVLYTLNGLGSEYHEFAASICAQDASLSFEELHDKLVGYEVFQKREESATETMIASLNSTHHESEYCAVATTASELVWAHSLLSKIGISFSSPPMLSCDNIGASYLSVHPVLHSRMKHVSIDVHFVHGLGAKGHLTVSHVCTKNQLSDVLTKLLSKSRFQLLHTKIRVLNRDSMLQGCIGPDTFGQGKRKL
ncbi:hypothetical protein ACH5RR_023906 [Cinchona calisaya]|uniref:Uncharacterized protein n=1 Tax=Cinchona calisaya TaxID=153742 RepID=A0ABD2ZBZ7_9GENT